MPLKIKIERKKQDIFVLSLAGVIDSETYMDLETAIGPLLGSSVKAIMLDMGGVTYISSMGLRTIFKTRDVLEKAGGALMMVNLCPQVEKVFSVLKVIPDLDIFESMEEADDYLIKIQKGGFKGK